MSSGQNILLLIVGKKGHGKTTLARAIAAAAPRSVVLDPKSEFGGAPVCGGAAAAEWLWEMHRKTEYALIVRPVNVIDEAAFWRIWFDPAGGGFMADCMLVIDEVDRWCGPNNCEPALWHLIHYGRHQSVDLVVTCRRAANIGPTLRSQADNIVAFRTDEPLDVEQLGKVMDVSGLDNLAPGEYIEREPCDLTAAWR